MPAYADNIITADTSGGRTSQTENKDNLLPKNPTDDVVVSGMSGRFPESSSVKEFSKNLYEGVDMVTENDRRWTPGLFGLPTRSGKLLNLSNFDASFFGVSPRQAHCMDPQLRLLLEVTYEAIFDAGVHPYSLKGKRIGVYVGVSGSETEEFITQDPDKITGYELTGCCRAMFANRLSYALDVKGPSFAIDTACSSALVALETAFRAISSGEIEGAIVAGSNLTLKPQSSLQFHTLSMLSEDGRCKAFDSRANGYVRSEAVTAIFLQKRKDAIRIYAQVVQACANTDGHKTQGITFPSGDVQKALLHEVYKRAGVDPANVSYVEAHGTGTKAGDPQELSAITDVFCKNRSDPLMLGSVKSNMGHSEPASGICAIVKVLLAMQNREIPGNLHFVSPNPDIASLNDGRIKVVSENTPWRGQYAAINNFGFGGANVHVLLKAGDSPCQSENLLLQSLTKTPTMETIIPAGQGARLVLANGRTEEHVEQVLTEFQKNRNIHFAELLDNICETDASVVSFPYRGYTIVGGATEQPITQIAEFNKERTPLWLIFSGMGSQWKGCGVDLLELPPFIDVIQRCRSAMLPLGIDVLDIITREEPNPMKSTTASFTAIAAVQVGLVEVLKSIGLTEFDGFIGHSVGELGCGYADGSLTAEQTVLSAYWRGKAVEEAGLPVGKMAAVGLSAEEAQNYIGKNTSVTVACRNSPKSVTISGLKDEVELLQEKLDAEGIFCRSVDSGGIAFHHSTLRKAAPRLLSELQKVILCPMKRSSKWISSSVPEAKWGIGIAQKASPEYLVNNLVSPVLFAEALTKIPDGARVIEVAPHALMQAVLRRALPSCTMIPLVRKDSKDILAHLFQGIGKLYNTGEKLNLKALYDTPLVPVPVNTPSIASLVSWDHGVEWDVAKFSGGASTAEFKIHIDLNDPHLSYLEGHTIDGRVLFPATGYLNLAWKALGKLMQTKWEELPVTFTDVSIHQATVLSASNSGTTFTVRLLLNKGEFEVIAGEGLAASGKIHIGVKESSERKAVQQLVDAPVNETTIELSQGEIYKILKLRGYQYGGDFRSFKTLNYEGSRGEIEWKKDWITFLDAMLQASVFGGAKGLTLPTRIRRIHLEPQKLYDALDASQDKVVKFNQFHKLGIMLCPGVEIYGLKGTSAPRRAPSDNPVIEGYQFFPYTLPADHKMSTNLTFENAAKIVVDLVLENAFGLKIKIGHLLGQPDSANPQPSTTLALNLLKAFEVQPLVASDYSVAPSKNLPKDNQDELSSQGINLVDKLDATSVEKLNLLVVSQPKLENEDFSMVASLRNQSFILVDNVNLRNELVAVGLIEVASIEKFALYLLRKPNVEKSIDVLETDPTDAEFSWVEPMKEKILNENEHRVLLVSKGTYTEGLLGMVKCLRREPGGEKIRCLVDPNNSIVVLSETWHKILASDMAYNIVHGDEIGTMKHLPLPVQELRVSENAYLNVLTRGDLSSLTWLQAPPALRLEGRIPCSVSYAPLNFRDIMLASGKLPPDALPGSVARKECIYGLEFSGISENGTRLMGLLDAGGLATSVQADPYLTWEVPAEWSLREAATVPVVYATAYYALVIRGGLQPGESVLIHAGSGGVGQAAISIALSKGCTVFTTVSSEKKRNFLKERFPQLTDENFANSRDATFEFDVLNRTGGEGVDVVLNSLAGELLQASVRCLKEFGRFLEIGKADLSNNTGLGMSIFLKSVTFHGILLDALFEGSNERKKVMLDVVQEGINSGVVKPLAATIYAYHQVEDAFRFMASGKHIGKVVLEISPEEHAAPTGEEKPVKRKPRRKSYRSSDGHAIAPYIGGIPSVFRLWPKSDLVYVITGGLGGLGLELADWLLKRGATKLVLTSRRGVSTGYQAYCIRRWRSEGANVRVLTQDASTEEGAEKLLTEASEEGPVGGIFHLAVILEDSMLKNQNAEKFQRVCRVKANGAKFLDLASRKLCPQTHIWVTFSSVACGNGNAGQSNYGWANSLSERVVEDRVANGLPGCAIQFGGIGDVGVMAETLGNVEVAGTKPQSVQSVLACLDALIGSEIPVVSSMCLSTKNTSSKDGKGAKSLVSALANILGIRDVSKAPLNVSLGDLGMDSLMAIEIKQSLEREADIVLTADQIRDLTIGRIQEIESQGAAGAAKDASFESSKSSTENTTKEAFSWLNYPILAKESIKDLNQSSTTAPPLFIAAPIQGICDVLEEVASRVNTRVVGLQYTADMPSNNIAKLASSLVQKIEECVPEGPFYLGGYSFGASVAFEIASQMEAKGRKPISLILVDGSHSYVLGIINTYRSKYGATTDQAHEIVLQGESDALVTFTLQFCGVDALKLKSSLMGLPSFSDRLNFAANTILENVKSQPSNKLSAEEIKMAASLFFDRLMASYEHDSAAKVVSIPTMLIRASQNTHLADFGTDYGLSKVISGKLTLKEVDGTHESIIFGESSKNISSFINDYATPKKIDIN